MASLNLACSGNADPADPHSGGSAGSAGSAGAGGSHEGGSGGSDPGGTGGTGGTGGVGGSGGSGGATDFDASDIQLNDVSVLFPAPKNDSELKEGLLTAQAKGGRGVLLPEKLYGGVGPIVGSTDTSSGGIGGDLTALYRNLRVVALRIDPCFAEPLPPLDGKGCDNQLRLVVQEASVGGAYDSALHLFYSISRAEVLELTAAIGGLRQALAPGRQLGKLQPHPLMVEEGLAGAMSNGVKQAILAHAGEQNLMRITRMSAQQGPFWNFSGFDVKDGELEAMTIPTLPDAEAAQQTFSHGFGSISAAELSPASGSDDDVALLLNAEKATALSENARAAAVSKLLRIENPTRHSPNTIDCASCHITTPITKVVLEDLGWSTTEAEDAFVADPELFAAGDLAVTFESNEPITNVHAFSYGPDGVGINQRVVNESAAVVSYLRQQDFSAK